MGRYKRISESTFEIEEPAEHAPSRWKSWRVTVLGGALLATAILFTNIALLAWTLRKEIEVEDGIVTVYKGNCAVTKTISTYSHLVINILGTLLLSASNNCAQLLTSPTRKDISRMHKDGKWMDIGVPSLRNLRYISRWRAVLWTLLMLSSVPLHLLWVIILLSPKKSTPANRTALSYNSVLFTTTSGHFYHYMLVTEDFAAGGWWNQTRFDLQTKMPWNITGDIITAHQHALENKLAHIDAKQCVDLYTNPKTDFSAWPYGNLVVVVSAKLNDSAIAYNYDFDFLRPATMETSMENSTLEVTGPSSWTITNVTRCQVDPSLDKCSPAERARCDPGKTSPSCCSSDITVDCEIVTAPLAYCLAERYVPDCTVKVARVLLIIVVACNAVKIVAMLGCAFWMFRPLATIGDAVATFLEQADPHSAFQGLLSSVDVRCTKNLMSTTVSAGVFMSTATGARVHHGKVSRWRSAASIGGLRSRWVIALFTATSLLICGMVFLGIAKDNEAISPHLGGDDTVVPTMSMPTWFNVVLPNIPQILVSFVYIFYNNAITYMLLAYEWSTFASHRKPLRVTSPTGQQRSTFWLQIPYRYAVPLMVTMAVLHWLISQSIYLVQSTFHDQWGNAAESTNECDYSPFAILLAVVVGAVLILAFIAISFRKLEPGIPMVGSCSLAISAACGNTKEVDAATEPLKYGVLNRAPNEDGIRYVGFSQYEVQPLVDGVAYL